MTGFFWLTLWQRRWRHFGWVIIAVSAGLMFVSPKPDFIYDPKTQALGVKNASGRLEIYAKRMSGFAKNYWANWFGQADVVVHKKTIEFPLHLTQERIGLTCYSETLSKEELDKHGTVLIFSKEGMCRFVYDINERFKFG